MGSVLFKVSDLTGEIIEDETQLTRLVVESHPDYAESITLEVLPEEVEGQLPEQSEFVAFSYFPTNDPEPRRFIMPIAEFHALFPRGNADETLARALSEQQEQAQPQQRGGRRRQTSGRRPRVDYTSPEHAGEPHRGTISEAERIYVHDHLDEVNERLRQKGMREIDPTDLTMIERYGFTPPEL